MQSENCQMLHKIWSDQGKPCQQSAFGRLRSADTQSYPQILWTTLSPEQPAFVARQCLPNYGAHDTVRGYFLYEEYRVFEILRAAGWPIWPLLLASIIAVALIIERTMTLRRSKVVPPGLLESAIGDVRQGRVTPEAVAKLRAQSPLGRVLAAGLTNVRSSREVMKEAIEEAGRAVTHELERFLTSLGTIASIAPLMGLFGTVVGMIEIFGSQSPSGANPQQLAHGISVALYNTAFGLLIAIPAMIFYRHFRALVDSFVVDMEQQAVKLVEVVHGERK
jgi:biopolymer transport protein ExbB